MSSKLARCSPDSEASASSFSVGPRMSASGVRSSWLTLAKNWVLSASSSRPAWAARTMSSTSGTSGTSATPVATDASAVIARSPPSSQ